MSAKFVIQSGRDTTLYFGPFGPAGMVAWGPLEEAFEYASEDAALDTTLLGDVTFRSLMGTKLGHNIKRKREVA